MDRERIINYMSLVVEMDALAESLEISPKATRRLKREGWKIKKNHGKEWDEVVLLFGDLRVLLSRFYENREKTIVRAISIYISDISTNPATHIFEEIWKLRE